MDPSVIATAERIRAADPGQMLDRIKELPAQVRDAWTIAQGVTFPPHYSEARSVVVLGMGGSAIGGDLAAALLLDELRVPMAVHRDYGLPAYVGPDTLVIASSYSGNTEETLSGLEEAVDRGSRVVILTTGGRVADIGEAQGFPVVRFSYKAQPRAALGYSLGLMLGVLSRMGLVRDLAADVETAVAELSRLEGRVEEDAATNDAKALALALAGKVPFVYGAGAMGIMARRVKGQLNENAKSWAAFDVLPELNHNAVVGFPNPTAARGALAVLMLRSERDSARHNVRFEVTRELLDRSGVPVHSLRFPGSSALSEVLQMTMFTDHVTFYVALLNGADPTPVASIDFLKERLAAAP